MIGWRIPFVSRFFCNHMNGDIVMSDSDAFTLYLSWDYV